MQQYFLKNLSELAQKRAVLLRDEAQLFDILARDLKREASRLEETPVRRLIREPFLIKEDAVQAKEEKLFVRVAEAMKMMGLGHTALYNEINASRIKVRKAGRKTLIAVSDIHEWFRNLPEGISK